LIPAIPRTCGRKWSAAALLPGTSTSGAFMLVVPLLMLTGCAVGPDYKAPQPDLPANFSEQPAATAGTNSTIVPFDDWWTVFQDKTLDALMQEAARSAPDLAMADARIREARALRQLAASGKFPTLDAGGAYNRNHGSLNVPIGVPPGGLGPDETSDLWQAGFDASWEIDVFGGIRRQVQSANAVYQVEVASRREVALTLFAEMARDYIELRSTQEQLAITRDILSVEQTALSLVQSRFNAGLSSSRDLSVARADVSAVEAQLPPLITDEHAAIYRIAVLAGQKPEELLTELSAPSAIQTVTPPDVPMGLPSDLLRRRPDILVTERQLAAATARIGAAKADLYPHFYLTGMAGLESLNFNSFFNAASGYYSIGPGITWKVFDADKVRAKVLTERARTDEAAVAYQTTVLNALKEVETALVAYAQAKVRQNALADEIAADRKNLELAKQLYNRGVEDFSPVLDAQKTLENVEFEMADSNRETATALIALYKALGGGWEIVG